MSRLDATLAHLAPGVSACRDLDGVYNPRHGLAIYSVPTSDYSPASPGVILGEALAARSGLGCTLLEGIPKKIPEGAVVVVSYGILRKMRPDLIEDVPEPKEPGQYLIKLGRSALVTANSGQGLAAGMQTLAMLVLRHGEEAIPACLLTDTPFCTTRCLGIEVQSSEISLTLLMQIASFAATFKANSLHLILNGDFDPSREISGIETFTQTAHSYGMTIGVRLSLLGKLAANEISIPGVWAAIRGAARVFGAEEAVLDDPMPQEMPEEACRKLTASVIKGEAGLQRIGMDARVLQRSGVRGGQCRDAGVFGWMRLWDDNNTFPGQDENDIPLVPDIQAPVPAFTSRLSASFHTRLDAALTTLHAFSTRELSISFRNLGISHIWQNMLYPAATGLIAAWGEPLQGSQAAWRYSNLLYGESAEAVMAMWEVVSAAFPEGLTEAHERAVRRVAFGEWPDEATLSMLREVDWVKVTTNIREGAEILKAAAGELNRNAATLTGARLGLYALSWLHCFVLLMPELERRRRERYDGDGRTGPIAAELYNNFLAWYNHLQEIHAESGLELGELAKIDAMGLRLKSLCEGMFP